MFGVLTTPNSPHHKHRCRPPIGCGTYGSPPSSLACGCWRESCATGHSTSRPAHFLPRLKTLHRRGGDSDAGSAGPRPSRLRPPSDTLVAIRLADDALRDRGDGGHVHSRYRENPTAPSECDSRSRVLGIPFSWSPIHRLAGTAVCLLIGAVLIDEARHQNTLVVLSVGAASYLLADALLTKATGRSFAILWFTR